MQPLLTSIIFEWLFLNFLNEEYLKIRSHFQIVDFIPKHNNVKNLNTNFLGSHILDLIYPFLFLIFPLLLLFNEDLYFKKKVHIDYQRHANLIYRKLQFFLNFEKSSKIPNTIEGGI